MPSTSTAHLVTLPVPTDDLRIEKLQTLNPPAQVIGEAPATSSVAEIVGGARQAVHQILHGQDDRLVVVIGPCSIHDPKAAIDYARRLAAERERHAGELEVIMRVYFEKPRTTVGWKGLINDPGLDGGFRINDGLRLARRVLLDVSAQGLPAACEFLDVTTPQYIADLVSWGAIGARTTESQIHRELASGLSCPVGFKNGTNGDVKIAVDAVMAASQPHHFLAVTKEGRAAIATTTGNGDCHLVLRGGKTPNYDAASVAAAAEVLSKAGLPPRLMVDVSHANSGKNHENQPAVIADVCAQVATGASPVMGVMIESNLVAGRQDIVQGQALTYGQSVTDACVDWETSVRLLDDLAGAVRAGRLARGA
ncbi:3-deoxy-7-phosphoheptulonate synthase [Caulobacter vibrioides]|uniref:3-deoxy-7-phosphoheptulonate synthase n=1 Tax=Caulobacter vibrioides TaxID=155892 RepID=UPI000BB46E27|nr:3-deoxy-7-phosphoheptulonate synthase [Caulobacter vibrioides]ATC24419.1 3-deoxy-7-phosphoheptulonate synthase [Caulobacter vibrioides]AZH12572.1 3-deoxy-7-phosphoheptulonate synthase [Caulobacter vibrioides]PLR15004.1 3-deoxy-7-phosphoheptulonate synthase [Caulobacter vibrioides]